jgi:hypothetical protein
MKTSDVYLASACLALGYKLETVNRTDPRHMQFEFSSQIQTGALGELSKLELDEVEVKWANRSLTVNAFDFAEAIKRMKSIIHSS